MGFSREKVLLLVLVLHLIYGVYQARSGHYLLRDSQEYLHAAENLLTHQELYCGEYPPAANPNYYSKRPPLYPLLLVPFTALGWTPGGVIFLQILISLLACLLAWKLMEEFLENPAAGKIVFIALLFFLPAPMIYPNLVMTEVWLQLIILGMVWALWKAHNQKDQQVTWLLGHQLGVIAGFLLKPVMYLYIPVAGIALLILGKGIHLWKRIALLVLPFIVLMVYIGWNEGRTGYAHVSSIQQINLLNYNLKYTLIAAVGEDQANAIVDSIRHEGDAKPTYAQRQAFIQEAAVAQITSNLGAYTKMHLKGMINFFIDPGRFDLYNFWGIEQQEGKGFLYHYSKEGYKGIFTYLRTQPIGILCVLLVVFLANLLKTVGFIGFCLDFGLPVLDRLIIAAPVGYLAVLSGPLGASRFAMPVNLLMVIATAVFISRRYKRPSAANKPATEKE
ncbi:MAG: glycosyltransferase family 39 protein [Bacteroidota bacterium]